MNAGTGHAAEALHLTWNDCSLGGAGAPNLDFPCDTDAGQSTLFCAFTMPQVTDSVLALEVVVDVQHASPLLPDWWRFDVSGCRAGFLKANVAFGVSTCVDPWQGQASGGLLSYTVRMPRGGANQARIRAAFNVPSTQGLLLNASDMYYAARFEFQHGLTTGAAGCSGCAEPACLVLNSILVKRPPRPEGAASTDLFLQTPGANNGWATWQAGTGVDCQAVPVRNRTWGEVKSLYR